MLVLKAVAAVVLASTTTANATLDNATPEKTATVAKNSQLMACEQHYAKNSLWSPKGWTVDVEKTWKCNSSGSYDGYLLWKKRDSVKVWAEMRVVWHLGGKRQRKMTLGKKHPYYGADAVYMRACDSSGCGGWW